MPKPSNIVEVKSEEQLAQALANASGPVVLDFWQKGCHACKEEGPRVQKVAEDCPAVTVLKVEVDEVPALADKWNVEAMPTLFYAESPVDLTRAKAEELPDSSALQERLGGKCQR